MVKANSRMKNGLMKTHGARRVPGIDREVRRPATLTRVPASDATLVLRVTIFFAHLPDTHWHPADAASVAPGRLPRPLPRCQADARTDQPIRASALYNWGTKPRVQSWDISPSPTSRGFSPACAILLTLLAEHSTCSRPFRWEKRESSTE